MSWDHPVDEAEVPAANPQTIRFDGRSPAHYVIQESDSEIATACGRTIEPSREPLRRGAWVDTPFQDTCKSCARTTGLTQLDRTTVLEFVRSKSGAEYLVEADSEDSVPSDGLPAIEITPRDPDGAISGQLQRVLAHLRYGLATITTDHRDAALARFGPIFEADVTVTEAHESD